MLSRAFIRSIPIPRASIPHTYPVSLKCFHSGQWRRRLTSSSPVDSKRDTSHSLENTEFQSLFISHQYRNAGMNSGNNNVCVYFHEAIPLVLGCAYRAPKRPMLNSTINRIISWETRSYFSSKPEDSQNTPPSDNSSSTSDKFTFDKADTHAKDQTLADLTQGIPSTLDYEANRKNLDLSQYLMKPEESSLDDESRGRGSLPASAYITSLEKKRLKVANYLYGIFFFLSLLGTLYLGRNWGTDEEEKAHPQTPSGWSFGSIWKRARARISDKLNYYQEPAFRELLPDVQPLFERPYTLVLELEDLLICSEWSREHGWRLAKRPGVDYFLRYLSQYYELVLFTTQPSHLAEPIIRKLDPYHIIMWPLFREATLYENGEYTKV